MPNVITRQQDGTWIASGPLLITCGCGSVVPDARSAMRSAGLPDIPMLVSSSNTAVKAYVRQVGLTDKVPSLLKSKHAVLYNPRTGRYINMLNAPLNEALYENIRRVANG